MFSARVVTSEKESTNRDVSRFPKRSCVLLVEFTFHRLASKRWIELRWRRCHLVWNLKWFLQFDSLSSSEKSEMALLCSSRLTMTIHSDVVGELLKHMHVNWLSSNVNKLNFMWITSKCVLVGESERYLTRANVLTFEMNWQRSRWKISFEWYSVDWIVTRL